jgi:hypothetical protein
MRLGNRKSSALSFDWEIQAATDVRADESGSQFAGYRRFLFEIFSGTRLAHFPKRYVHVKSIGSGGHSECEFSDTLLTASFG